MVVRLILRGIPTVSTPEQTLKQGLPARELVASIAGSGRNVKTAGALTHQRVNQTRPSCAMCTTAPSNPFAVIS